MWVGRLKKSGEFFLEKGKQTNTNATMDIRSFTNKTTKDAEIDRLNEDRHPEVEFHFDFDTIPEIVEQGERRFTIHPADNTPHTNCGKCDCCIACGCCECDETESEAEERGAFEEGGQALLDCLLTERRLLGLVKATKPDPDAVSAEIVPDSPKKATRPLLVVRGVNTRELYWKIPAEIDLDDQETYEYGDKWGTLYITNKKTGQEWELEAKGGDEDFKRCDETHIESYDEHSWWWGSDDEEE